MVDPGPADEPHTAAIVAAAAPLGPIRTILVTHTHVDHAPGAAALAAATGARVVGFGPAEGFAPDERVGRGLGAALSRAPAAASLTLRALHTPGHASDHLCWLVEEHALLLTGDHVMHGSTVVIRPPDGDLHQYLASLARVRDDDAAHPHAGAGPRAADGPRARGRRRADRPPPGPPRAASPRALRRARRATVDELLPEVYGDVTERQLPVARFSLWAHLRALGQEGTGRTGDAATGRGHHRDAAGLAA